MQSAPLLPRKFKLRSLKDPWRVLSLWTVFAIILWVIFTFQIPGVTWDEPLHVEYGDHAWNFYTSFFTDYSVFYQSNLPLYGALFDLIVRSFHWAAPLVGEFELRHLLTALSGVLGLVGVWRLGQCCCQGSPTAQRTGFFSLMFLAVVPMYSGHLFNNGKDIPFAAACTWSLYFVILYLRSLPSPSRKVEWSTAIVLGLTCAVRIGGVLLFVYLWLFLLLQYFKDRNIKSLISGFKVSCVGYLVMTLFWPLAIIKPIIGPLQALLEMQNFDKSDESLYWGQYWLYQNLPRHYIPGLFLVQLPEIFIVCFVFGFVVYLFTQARSRPTYLLALSICFPVAYAILKHSVVYDAVRHFLFILPPMAVFAALGLDTLLKVAREKIGPPGERGLGLIALIATATTLVQTAELYPYQYIYYNRLAGGVPGAFGRFEMDYWAQSFKEAAEKLQDYEAAHPTNRTSPVRVAIKGPLTPLFYYLSPEYRIALGPEAPDYKVVLGRFRYFQDNQQGEQIMEISREGVPLTRIYKMK